MLESGLLKDAGDRYELSGPLPPLAIPSTLHDSLHRPPRPPRAGQGGGADRRRDRPRVLARAARGGRRPAGDRAGSRPRPAGRFRAGLPPRRRRPMRPTASSTRWSRTPPTRACSSRSASNSMPASPRCWSNSSRMSATPRQKCWHTISSWPVFPSRQFVTCESPESKRSDDPATPKQSSTYGEPRICLPICGDHCQGPTGTGSAGYDRPGIDGARGVREPRMSSARMLGPEHCASGWTSRPCFRLCYAVSMCFVKYVPTIENHEKLQMIWFL